MKKTSFVAAIFSLAMLLNGCQTADDSNTSDEEQGDENSVAMNGGDTGAMSGMGDAGYGSESGSGAPGSGGPDAAGGTQDPANYGGNTPGLGGPDTAGGTQDPANYGGNTPGLGGPDTAGGTLDPANYGSNAPGLGGSGLDNTPGVAGGNIDYGAGLGGLGGGSGSIPQYKEGTAEDAIMQIWLVIKEGKQEGLEKFISTRAKGDLAALRDGTLAKEKLDELKQQMARIKFSGRKTSGATKTISLQNEVGRTFKFTCRKEDGTYYVREFENKEPSKRKRRGR